jgi:hypothetical protein
MPKEETEKIFDFERDLPIKKANARIKELIDSEDEGISLKASIEVLKAYSDVQKSKRSGKSDDEKKDEKVPFDKQLTRDSTGSMPDAVKLMITSKASDG